MTETSLLVTPILGTPFVLGGDRPRVGMDCWGVVRWLYSRAGVELPSIMPGDDLADVEDRVSRFEMIGDGEGDATELLDLLVSRDSERRLHVSVLTCLRPALCASVAIDDEVRLFHRWSLRGVEAVYRHSEARA